MITRHPDKGFSKSPRFSVYIDGVRVAEVVGSPVNLRNGDKRVKPWDRNRGHLTPGQRGRAYTVTALADIAKAWEGLSWYTADYAWEAIQDMYEGRPVRGEDLCPPPAR